MAQLIADKRDIDFVLYEQLGAADFEKIDTFLPLVPSKTGGGFQ